jgi:hypothetical protein
VCARARVHTNTHTHARAELCGAVKMRARACVRVHITSVRLSDRDTFPSLSSLVCHDTILVVFTVNLSIWSVQHESGERSLAPWRSSLVPIRTTDVP